MFMLKVMCMLTNLISNFVLSNLVSFAGSKQAIKDAFYWMDESRRLNEALRNAIEAQADSGRKLVKFDRYRHLIGGFRAALLVVRSLDASRGELRVGDRRKTHRSDNVVTFLRHDCRGKNMAKKQIDPNLLATEILEGGWVELNIDYPDKKENLSSVLSSSLEDHSSANEDLSSRTSSVDQSCRAKLAETNFFKRFPDATAG